MARRGWQMISDIVSRGLRLAAQRGYRKRDKVRETVQPATCTTKSNPPPTATDLPHFICWCLKL